MTLRLTIEEIMQNARKALAERRLQFQVIADHPEVRSKMVGSGFHRNACVYDLSPMGFPGCGCAIGVSLPPGFVETIAAKGLNLNDDIGTLVGEGLVEMIGDELDKAVAIQQTHDALVDTLSDGAPKHVRKELMDRFISLIGGGPA